MRLVRLPETRYSQRSFPSSRVECDGSFTIEGDSDIAVDFGTKPIVIRGDKGDCFLICG